METTQLALICLLVANLALAGALITLAVLTMREIRRGRDSLLARELRDLEKKPAKEIHVVHNGESAEGLSPEDAVLRY